MSTPRDEGKLAGVERFLKNRKIVGADADQIREWARDSLYWNALIILDPADIVTVAMGAENHADMEREFRARIERRLGLLP